MSQRLSRIGAAKESKRPAGESDRPETSVSRILLRQGAEPEPQSAVAAEPGQPRVPQPASSAAHGAAPDVALPQAYAYAAALKRIAGKAREVAGPVAGLLDKIPHPHRGLMPMTQGDWLRACVNGFARGEVHELVSPTELTGAVGRVIADVLMDVLMPPVQQLAVGNNHRLRTVGGARTPSTLAGLGALLDELDFVGRRLPKGVAAGLARDHVGACRTLLANLRRDGVAALPSADERAALCAPGLRQRLRAPGSAAAPDAEGPLFAGCYVELVAELERVLGDLAWRDCLGNSARADYPVDGLTGDLRLLKALWDGARDEFSQGNLEVLIRAELVLKSKGHMSALRALNGSLDEKVDTKQPLQSQLRVAGALASRAWNRCSRPRADTKAREPRLQRPSLAWPHCLKHVDGHGWPYPRRGLAGASPELEDDLADKAMAIVIGKDRFGERLLGVVRAAEDLLREATPASIDEFFRRIHPSEEPWVSSPVPVLLDHLHAMRAAGRPFDDEGRSFVLLALETAWVTFNNLASGMSLDGSPPVSGASERSRNPGMA